MFYELKLKAGDELRLEVLVDAAGQITKSSLKGVGGPEMLQLLKAWRSRITGRLNEIEVPEGKTGPELMLKELILKARGEWVAVYQDQELCHCRAVPTAVVEQAIFAGAHTPEKVSRWTSASTACGTCRKDVEKILQQKLGSN